MATSKAKTVETRRAALLSYSRGASVANICNRYKISAPTLKGWAKGAKVEHGSNYTPKQIIALLARQRETIMQEDLDLITDPQELIDRDHHVTMTHGPAMSWEEIEAILLDPPDAKEVAEEQGRKAEDRKKQIITEQATLKQAFDGMMDDKKFVEYITARRNQVVAAMEQETTPQGMARALMVGGLLTQLAIFLTNPTPLNSWTEAVKLMDKLEDLLGMKVQTKGAGNGPNLFVINSVDGRPQRKVGGGKVIEIGGQ
jgi:transposase-like protein